MAVLSGILRVGIAALTIVAVAELSKRFPRYGALLLSLPTISILAFIMSWVQHHDLAALSRMSRETVILVVLGLPFFIPLAFATKLGLGFWPATMAGMALASLMIVAWFTFGPAQ